MEIKSDKYLCNFIRNYKDQIMGEDDEVLKKNLLYILDSAIEFSDSREEFFELLSYGNYLVSTYKGNNSEKDSFRSRIKNKLVREERMLKFAKTRSEEEMAKDPVDPFEELVKELTYEELNKEVDALPEVEKRVIKKLYYEDGTIISLKKEIGRGREYILSIKQSAENRIGKSFPLRYLCTNSEWHLKFIENFEDYYNKLKKAKDKQIEMKDKQKKIRK